METCISILFRCNSQIYCDIFMESLSQYMPLYIPIVFSFPFSYFLSSLVSQIRFKYCENAHRFYVGSPNILIAFTFIDFIVIWIGNTYFYAYLCDNIEYVVGFGAIFFLLFFNIRSLIRWFRVFNRRCHLNKANFSDLSFFFARSPEFIATCIHTHTTSYSSSCLLYFSIQFSLTWTILILTINVYLIFVYFITVSHSSVLLLLLSRVSVVIYRHIYFFSRLLLFPLDILVYKQATYMKIKYSPTIP